MLFFPARFEENSQPETVNCAKLNSRILDRKLRRTICGSMKTLILSLLVVVGLTTSARAQLFGPESLGGAFWGGLMGGILGGNCHNGFSGEAAAIGAGIGFISGAIAGEARKQAAESGPYVYPAYAYPAPGYVVAPRPAPYVSYPLGRLVVAPRYVPRPVRAAGISIAARPNSGMAPRVPDAPSVPDAPTF